MYWHILWMLVGFAMYCVTGYLGGYYATKRVGHDDSIRVCDAVAYEHFAWIKQVEKCVGSFIANILLITVPFYVWPFDCIMLVWQIKVSANKIIAEREGS